MGRTVIAIHIVIMVLMMIYADAWTRILYSIRVQMQSLLLLSHSLQKNHIFNQTHLSPCDPRLSLPGGSAQLAVFRPKVDEISLLTNNSTTFNHVRTCRPTKSFGFFRAHHNNDMKMWDSNILQTKNNPRRRITRLWGAPNACASNGKKIEKR